MIGAATRAADGGPDSPSDEAVALWPFGALVALVAVPAVWLALAVVLWMTHRWLDWPTATSASGLVYLAVAVGLVPVGLLVLNAVARGGGAVTSRWGGIDFGTGVKVDEGRQAVQVETSLGFEGQPITDSSVATVHETVNAARANDVVRLDIGTGDSWWMTRLFALCYGAVRTDSPKVLVFVAQDSEPTFVGWVRPQDGLRLLRSRRPHLAYAADRAESIARYMTTVDPNTAQPAPPPPAPPGAQVLSQQWATSYAASAAFQGLGEETALRVLLDLLGKYEANPGAPYLTGGERVTTGVLLNVFGTELHKQAIDVSWPADRQLDEFFGTTDEYVAILDRYRFVRIVRRSLLENALLRQAVTPKAPVP
jgi:hypothetical protein